MNITVDKGTLTDYYNETIKLIPENQLYRFNLRSVKNFIDHLDKVDSPRIAGEAIFDYLTYIRTIETPKTAKEIDMLFKRVQNPIGFLYGHCGFILIANFWLLLAFWCFIFTVLFLFSVGLKTYLTFATLMIVLFVRRVIKQKQGKVYGPGW
ncbi:MAG: hypothetical protein ACXVPN_03890 [Bacteroidia bacterium]